ncbi:MAG: hypothetical protein JRF64_00460 [Deltaproteobacteria bacterium]|nr:hypothetical protein [Deltaproteobacteria bacterium]
MRSFTITTLGCKVNRYESEAISEQLIDQGWYVMDEGITADLCIINTCTVTQKAAMQSRQAARKVIRNHPGATVMVTGCYAQVAPEIFSAMPGVHCVVGNAFKDQRNKPPASPLFKTFRCRARFRTCLSRSLGIERVPF